VESLVCIEVLHVAWQEQETLFPTRRNAASNAKHFHCSCHATWLPCKTCITGLKILEQTEEKVWCKGLKINHIFPYFV